MAQEHGGGIRVLLVEDNRVDALLIKDAAAKAETGDYQVIVDHVLSLGDAVERLRTVRYDVILLDLMLPDSLGLETVIRTHQAVPGTPIVVLSGVDDETMAIRAVQSGAQDYLVKGQYAAKQVMRAIRYAVLRFETRAVVSPSTASKGGAIITIAGSKGGLGTTMLACHLAVELQAYTGKRALLLDLDLWSGMVAFVMKAVPTYSIVDATQNIDRLDDSFWQSLVVRGGHDLDILGAPATPPGEETGMAESLPSCLQFLRLRYDWIVIDAGTWPALFRPTDLSDFDHFFLVTSPDLMALYRTKQIVRMIADSGAALDQAGLVVNRLPKRPDVEPREIESLLGMQVYAVLPETDEISDALVRGALASKGTDFAKAIEKFAKRLAGGEEPTSKERRSLLFRPFRFERA